MVTSKPAKKSSKPRTRRGSGKLQFLTQEELKRLFAVIKDKRDKALFLLAYRHGLRATEIGLLQRTDVDLKQGRITIHRLKGSLSGIYPLQPDVIKLLRSYLRSRTDSSPYLFISNRGTPPDRRTLWCAMQVYGKRAGLPPEKHKFHSLKHSIATHLLDARGELKFVQDWVGHKNIQNTTRYAQLTNPRRDDEAASYLQITESCEHPPMLFQESDIKFESLDSGSFEELCFDLLVRLGFHSLIWRQGGADSGRDIEASYTIAHPLVKHYDDRWFVECKLYKGGVPVDELSSKVAWAEAERPNHLLIITSSYLSNSAREWLNKRAASVPFRIHVIEGKQLTQLLLGYSDLIERFFINRYAKLLNEAIQNWILHDLRPELEILSLLFEHLDPQRLTPGEVAFLWCIYLLNKGGIEQWEESSDEVFPTMPLFALLASQAEEREELVRSIRGVGYGKADARHSFDASGENYAVVDLIQDDGSGPCRAFYSYYVPQAGTGLELVVLGRPDLAVRIRRMGEGEYKDLSDVLHRMSQSLNKDLRVQ